MSMMSSTIDTDNTKTRTRRKILVFPAVDEEDFAIDEDDYLVLNELCLAEGMPGDEIEAYARNFTKIQLNDEERRVDTLVFNKIKTLPPSIGRLQNLQYLDLNNTRSLLELPEEIGDLTSLINLDLTDSGITSFPPSIGRLQNLQYLYLDDTEKLLKLPEEIGDLSSLHVLNLFVSGITSLPPSIGRLQNLRHLNIGGTSKLLQLPEEIGDLVSLEFLLLNYSDITSLPPSIGRLPNLKRLDLSYTNNLLELPEEIGDIASLNDLNLDSHCEEDVRGEDKLFFALACNGARSRIIQSNPKLWPRMLNNATRAFDDFKRRPNKIYHVSKPDAMYQLLVEGRESFLKLVGNRNKAYTSVVDH